jgi:hypothetical protein
MAIEQAIKNYANGLTFGGVPVVINDSSVCQTVAGHLYQDTITRQAIARDMSELVARIQELKAELKAIRG